MLQSFTHSVSVKLTGSKKKKKNIKTKTTYFRKSSFKNDKTKPPHASCACNTNFSTTNNMALHIESPKNQDEPRCASCIQPLIAKVGLRLWWLLAHKDNKRPVRQLKEVGKLLKLLAHTHLLIVYLLPLFHFQNVFIKAPRAWRKTMFLPAG